MRNTGITDSPIALPAGRVFGSYADAIPPPRIERRQLCILIADVAGFSRQVEFDALATVLRLHELRRRLILPTMHAHRGWIASSAGDATLMAFLRSMDAVNCAVELQRALNSTRTGAAVDGDLRLHMGISAGESIAVDGELYGHPLNVAARLQALAEPGDIYLSDDVVAEVGDAAEVRFEALGRCELRNITQPVHVYRIARGSLEG
ncbi:adenylate/guanylate cyclase domain-containing protein [Inquilinus limosus]|uniref:adenylate/guanylate cyclase domain-containing protein n=1 Tax=Inquilinus limosus TaxID=171674 RepID=UPI003F166F18